MQSRPRRAAPPLLAVWTLACSPAAPAPAAAPSVAASHGDALHAMFAAEWEVDLREDPIYAPRRGAHRFDDRWRAASPAAHERRAAHDRDVLARARAVDPTGLSQDDRVSLALFVRERALRVEGEPFRLW